MSDLTTLTPIEVFSTYQVDAIVDPTEQNDNENRYAGKINTIIAALNDGTVVQTGQVNTFTMLQTFTGGLAFDAFTSTGAGLDTIYTNNGAGRLKIENNSPSSEVATQLFVNTQIMAGVVNPIDFTGASAVANGVNGLVPQPLAGEQAKLLKGNGNWENDLPFADADQVANFNAVIGEGYYVDTTGGVITATLPATPNAGDRILFVDSAGRFQANNFTLDRNGNEIMNLSEDMEVNLNYARLVIEYTTARGWVII